MSDQLENVRHDYIRYANCWEDADVLIKGLDLKPGDRILSIASAGDNSFSMLTSDPDLVVAVDVNPIQLNLIALKKAAFQVLDHETFLKFLGFTDCTTRWQIFLQVKHSLSPEMSVFWSERKTEIADGLIHQGKFEKYFTLFHKRILPFIHTKKIIAELFEEKSASQQLEFHDKKWNNWRWRFFIYVFFGDYIWGRFGRDPLFLKEVKVPVSAFILGRTYQHLSKVNCQNNYFLQYILRGSFMTQLPHYARKENFEKIKSRLDKLEIYHGLAEDAFNKFSDFNKFNLSNIFEYMDPGLFKTVSDNLIENGRSGSRYAYWNLLVPRRMSELSPALQHQPISKELAGLDCGFFYGNFIIDEKL
jgi:S-adenosylmethionine-diacylglycerol 3-amino-3-carboxypropyl transferase